MIEIYPPLMMSIQMGVVPDFRTPYEVVWKTDSDTIDSAGRAAQSWSAALQEQFATLPEAITQLSAAWSATQPQAALQQLTDAGTATAQTIGQQAGRLIEAASVMRTLKQQADQNIVEVNKMAAASYPAAAFASGTLAGLLPTELRQACQQTRNELIRIAREVEMEQLRVRDYILAEDVRQWVDQLPQAAPGGPYEMAFPECLLNETVWDRDARLRAQLKLDLNDSDERVRSLAHALTEELARAGADGTQVQLLSYSPREFDRQGMIAYSVGDITTSDAVATLTGGIFSSPRHTAEFTEAAKRVRDSAEQAGASNPVVVVTVPYHVPGSEATDAGLGRFEGFAGEIGKRTILDDDRAAEAAGIYASHIDDLRNMARPGATMTTIGFSYGGLVTMQALHAGAKVDTAVIAGSPGSGRGVETLYNLPNLAPGGLTVAKAPEDIVVKKRTDIGAALGKGQIITGWWATPFGDDPQDIGGRPMYSNGAIPGHSLHAYTNGQFLEATGQVIAGNTSRAVPDPVPLPGLNSTALKVRLQEMPYNKTDE